MKKFWRIQIWDGTDKLFECTVPHSYFSEKKLAELLRTLTAKHGLSENEIIGCYTNKGARIHSDFLEVHPLYGNKFTLTCGSNPYSIATLIEEVNNSSIIDHS